MSAPLDQQVVDALAALLRNVRRGNGFRTNAGEFVFTEESPVDLPPGAIAMELLDVDEILEEQRLRQRRAVLNLRLDIVVPKDQPQNNPRAQARAALADAREAIATINATSWLPGVTRVDLGGRRIPPRVDGSQFVEASLDLRVTFVETHTRS